MPASPCAAFAATLRGRRGAFRNRSNALSAPTAPTALLQEDFVTIREDRYVVPIVAGQKGRVDGVIHGSSGTGRTLFVEPLETIDLNNQLVRLREDELREIDRILLEITDSSAGTRGRHRRPPLQTLAQFDLRLCQSRFRPATTTPSSHALARVRAGLFVREARHPLLETVLRKARRPIVPIHFELD